MIDKKVLSWLLTVPSSDTNFQMQLKDANKDTIKAALKDKSVNKTKRIALEKRLNVLINFEKWEKDNIQYAGLKEITNPKALKIYKKYGIKIKSCEMIRNKNAIREFLGILNCDKKIIIGELHKITNKRCNIQYVQEILNER